MPDYQRHAADNDSGASLQTVNGYTIRRKGSRYNIVGPDGRVFTKNKSASIVGPRWEELTHTPWPYPSSAYEPGTRLWQLGLIDRKDVGKKELASEATPAPKKRKRRPRMEDAPETPSASTSASEKVAKAADSPTAKPRAKLKPLKTKPKQLSLMEEGAAQTTSQPEKDSAAEDTAEAPAPDAAKAGQSTTATQDMLSDPPDATTSTDKRAQSPSKKRKPSRKAKTPRSTFVTTEVILLALPAPRIDLDKQTRTIQSLRRNPKLLFNAGVRDALQNEVDYHRPYAHWAQTLLTLLERYERRQRRARTTSSANNILAKHIAWQEERLRKTSASS